MAYANQHAVTQVIVSHEWTNNLAQWFDYAPYGSVIAYTNNGPTVATRQYVNRFADQSNLDYLNARYYDPARGQFISQDPVFRSNKQNLMKPQSLNSYSYANDNPITGKDPDGLASSNTGQIIALIQQAVAAIQQIMSILSGGGGGTVSSGSTPSASAGGGSQGVVLGANINVPAKGQLSSTYYNRTFASKEQELLGKRYALGRDGPEAFDCSGAIIYGIRESGINRNFGDYTADQLYRQYSTPADNTSRGTVNYYDYTGDGTIDHATTNLGNGMIFHPSENLGTVYPRNANDFYNAIKNQNQNAVMYTMQINWRDISQ